MKRALLTLLLISALFSLGACMFMGAEDREFYGKGWVNPKELDKQPAPPMAERANPDDTTSVRTIPHSQDNGEWSTPAPH